MWKPWSRDEVERLLAEETARLPEPERQKLGRLRQPTAPVAWRRLAGFGDDRLDVDSTWLVARSGQEVLFYDTVELEFGIGRLGEDGVLTDYRLHGEKLAWALRHVSLSG